MSSQAKYCPTAADERVVPALAATCGAEGSTYSRRATHPLAGPTRRCCPVHDHSVAGGHLVGRWIQSVLVDDTVVDVTTLVRYPAWLGLCT